MVLEKKVNIKPISYAELNRLSEDFGKHFVPQQELSDEQDFQLHTSHPNTDQSCNAPLRKEDVRVFALETKMSEFKQASQFVDDVSSILSIVDNYLASKMKDAVDVVKVHAQVFKIIPKIEKYVIESLEAEVLILIYKMEENKSTKKSKIQKNLYNALVKSYNSVKDIITSYGDVVTLKSNRDDQDKDEDPSAGSNQGSKRKRSGKEAELSKEPTHKKSKSISSSKGATRSQPKSLGKSAHVKEMVKNSPTPNREWHKTKTVDNQPPQPWITQMAQATGTKSLFSEFLAAPIDSSAFIMNRLKIDNLTQEVLTDPTYDLTKGTCKSVVELEYYLEEVFRATNDRLDWHNLEGKPYPHDLSKPLPLIQNERGRQVIPYDYFINNDLEYLKGASLSKKYTTFITKTKAADYGQVKWIEDKRFYRYASNIESSYDVYSKNRIITVTSLKIMKCDELHKFNDDTLNHVRTALNDIAIGIEMDYLPKRKWIKQEKQKAHMMINAIDRKLKNRRLMRNLEKFVGKRPYGGDLRLLERTISYVVLIFQVILRT
nr:hypothetical protein [Tanacetum cinerariifolium]